MAIGVNAGDKVSMWATNTPEWIVTLFATAKIGAVLVTVNTNYKTFELEYLLNQSDTKVLVLMKGFKDSDYVGITRELLGDEKGNSDGKISCKRLPVLERVIYSTPGEVPEDMLGFGKLKELGKAITDEEFEERFASVGVNDIVNMQYTSGTTGFPKGVMLTHRNIVNNGKCIGDGMKFTDKDKYLRAVFSLFRVGSCRHGGDYARHRDGAYRPLQSRLRNERYRKTSLHGNSRRADYVYSHVGASVVCGERFFVVADGYYGRFSMSRGSYEQSRR